MKVLGIDIGGSGMKAAIVDLEKGKFVGKRKRIDTPKPATPEAMLDTVEELVDHFKWKGSIGCGFPASVINGKVKTASNIDKSWIGKNLEKLIEERTACQCKVMNDVDVAGLGELHFGAGKSEKGTLLMIAVGTGIGSALFHQQHLVPNTELGHIQLRGDIAEKYAANSIRKKKDLSWKDWGKRLNEYLLEVDKLFWPDKIVLGGGVSKKFEEYQDYLNPHLNVIPAQLRNHAGIIGAACLYK